MGWGRRATHRQNPGHEGVFGLQRPALRCDLDVAQALAAELNAQRTRSGGQHDAIVV